MRNSLKIILLQHLISVLLVVQYSVSSPATNRLLRKREYGEKNTGEVNKHSSWSIHPSFFKKDVVVKHVRKDVESNKLKESRELLESIENELKEVKRAYDETKQTGPIDEALKTNIENTQHPHDGKSN